MLTTGTLKKRKESGLRPRGATLAEIAEKAGVSTVAASVVLNASRTGTRVSQATRERILEVAQELKYTPNALARSLRTQKTHVLAFYNAQNVVFEPRYPFYAAILAGMQAGCTEHKKDLLIHANFQARSDDDIFNGLHNGQIDGLVLFVRSVTPLVERLVASHLPVVTVAEEVPGLPYIGIDEIQGGRLLAQHLAAKKYKRVLYRSLDDANVPLTQKQREAAFCEEAARLGLEVSHSLYHPRTDWPTAEEQHLLLGPKDRRPQVVVNWGDVAADELVLFCIEQGIKVPQEMAITGFDGFPSMRRPSLQLTTIVAPWFDVARTAVGLLSQQCEGYEVAKRTILPVELLEGDTT